MQEQMLAIAGVAYKAAILKPGLEPEDRALHGGCGMMVHGIWAQKKAAANLAAATHLL